MPQASPANDLFARAASKIVDVFGERTPHGELATTTMTLPNGKDVPLVGVIVGQMDVTRIEDDRGNLVKRETIRVSIPRHSNDIEARIYKEARFVVPPFGERIWVPQQDGSQVSDSFIDYNLERKPLAKRDQKQDAAV